MMYRLHPCKNNLARSQFFSTLTFYPYSQSVGFEIYRIREDDVNTTKP